MISVSKGQLSGSYTPLFCQYLLSNVLMKQLYSCMNQLYLSTIT